MAAVLTIGPLAESVNADGRPLPTIEEVCSHVDETLSSLVTISVEYRQVQRVNPDSPFEITRTDHYDLEPHRWSWEMHRSKRMLFRPAAPAGAMTASAAVHRAFDGNNTYNAFYDPSDASKMTMLQINDPGTFRSLTLRTPDTWIALRLSGSDHTLLSLLQSDEASVLGWESVDGHSCLRIKTKRVRVESGELLRCEVWLDTERDWLPRKIVLWRKYPEPYGDVPTVQIVSAFQRVRDRLLGRERWFPKSLSSSQRLITNSEVLSVTVNDQQRVDSFAIQPQVGTQVSEWGTDDPGRPVTSFIFGGNQKLSERREAIVKEAATQPLPASMPLVNAEPNAGNAYVTVIPWVLGGALAIWALLIWWRQ